MSHDIENAIQEIKARQAVLKRLKTQDDKPTLEVIRLYHTMYTAPRDTGAQGLFLQAWENWKKTHETQS